MIVNLGGSGGLDFHVVGGTTQPSNPKENTIWVNTSTDIPHYVVHYTPPTSETYKVNGAIWICDNSLTWRSPDINIAKNKEKLYLPVFPTNVQQYENGAWVRKTAYVYKSGAWTQVSSEALWLFNNGDDCTANTGGWSTYNYANGISGTYNYGTGVCTKNSGNFVLQVYPEQGIARQTKNKINLSNYSKIEIKLVMSGTKTYAHMDFFASSSSGAVATSENIAAKHRAESLHTSTTTLTLDISSLSGSYYVGVGEFIWGGSAGLKTTVYSMRLI